jgi:hypothetical protein
VPSGTKQVTGPYRAQIKTTLLRVDDYSCLQQPYINGNNVQENIFEHVFGLKVMAK